VLFRSQTGSNQVLSPVSESKDAEPKLTISIKRIRTHVRGGRGAATTDDDTGIKPTAGGNSTGMMF